ncbi:MAG: hypothetical protein ACYTGZ_07045 [Planctomycetota bacterium]|jgi:hypothetical protein
MKKAPAAFLFAAVLLVACGDSDRTYTIEEVRTDRAPEIPNGVGRSDVQRLRLSRMPAGHPPAGQTGGGQGARGPGQPGAPVFTCDLPEGWKKLPKKQFRDANFTLERDSSVECYLTVMPGGGGGLAGNVNRWRGQMKQPAMEPAELGKLPKAKMFGRDGVFVELNGTFTGRGGGPKDDYGFLAIYLEMPGTTLTLKMTGPNAVVSKEKDNFLKVAGTLRLEAAHGSPHGSKPEAATGSDGIAAGMASGASGFAWDTPEGWTKGRDRRMRIVTLHPAGNKDAQCYVAMMGGDGGGLDMNINRWLDQVGQPPLKPQEIAKLPTINMLGAKGVLIESAGKYTGMGDEEKKGAGLIGIVCLLEGRAVFVKFIGPADLVKSERAKFIAFSRSLRPEE